MSTYTLVQLYNPESSGSSGIQEFWYPYTKKAGVLDLVTFPGATSTTTGSEGLVPSAAIGDRNKYLRGDGKWADPPTGSGGGLQYEFTLNGSTYSGSTLSGDSGIYAPTASGVSKAILMGGAGNVPAWYNPGTIAGLLKFNGTSWQIDSASYSTTTGTVTSIVAGKGLNTTGSTTTSDGGAITGAGTFYLTKCTTQTGTKGPIQNATASYSSTFKVPYVQVDNWGRVTGSGEVEIRMPTASQFTLNGATTGSGLDLSNGGIYAPTTGGSQWALLTGGTGNIPSWWTPNGSNPALLKYNPTNGWLLDSSSYVVEQSNFFMYQNGTSGNPGGFGNLKNGEDIVFRAGNNIAITGSSSGTHHIITFNAAGGGSTPSIAPGTGLSLTNSTMSLKAANSTTIGGVGVIGSYNVSAGTNYSTTGIRFPLALSAESTKGFVGIPLAATSNSSYGLLKVAADANPGTGYQNTDYLTAVPVFYGTITNLKPFKERLPIGDTAYDGYVDGKEFTGHYINVRDVFNGIIQDEEMMHTFWWILHNLWDGWRWPWIPKQ